MKNLFGVNITESKNNTEYDSSIFVTQKVSQEQSQALDIIGSQQNDLYNNSTIPKWLNIVQLITAAIGIIISLTEIKTLLKKEVTLAESYNNAPYLFYIAIICWIIFIILTVINKAKTKKVLNSEEYEEFTENAIDIFEESSRQLNIPQEPETIDVFMFRYKAKNEKDKLVSFGLYNYTRLDFFAYVQDANFCLATIYEVIAIPLSSIRDIRKAKKRAMFQDWGKEEDYTAKKYKKFKITKNNQGTYFAYYYIVTINDIKGDFELFIPNYDIDIFLNFTSMRIDEE